MSVTEQKADLSKAVVPATILVSSIVAVASLVWFLSGLDRQSERQDLLTQNQLERLQERVEESNRNFEKVVNRSELELWVYKLRASNPEMNVPEFKR